MTTTLLCIMQWFPTFEWVPRQAAVLQKLSIQTKWANESLATKKQFLSSVFKLEKNKIELFKQLGFHVESSNAIWDNSKTKCQVKSNLKMKLLDPLKFEDNKCVLPTFSQWGMLVLNLHLNSNLKTRDQIQLEIFPKVRRIV